LGKVCNFSQFRTLPVLQSAGHSQLPLKKRLKKGVFLKNSTLFCICLAACVISLGILGISEGEVGRTPRAAEDERSVFQLVAVVSGILLVCSLARAALRGKG